MGKKIRILILEDVPADAALLEHELGKAGIMFITNRVETREEFLKGIKEFAPDLILADYTLPSFDCLSALAIAREECPEVPFIFITGSLSEEITVECMKAGGTDYVLKDHLVRIGPAIKGALEKKKVREEKEMAEEALKASNTRYRRLFETAKDGILLLDGDTGEITDVNPFMIEMLGYNHDEFLGKKLWEIGFFGDMEMSRSAFQRLQREGYFRYDYLPLKTKEKKPIDVEFVSNVYQVNGEKVIQCNIRDITECRRAEEELRRYREHLKQIVEERTVELEIANEQLQKKEIAEHKQEEDQIFRQRSLLSAVNKIFREALACEADEDVARIYLSVAEKLTGSGFGFIGELNEVGRLDPIVLSDRGWEACRMPQLGALKLLEKMEICSYWGRVLNEGRSQIVNDPASDPDRIRTPEGHPTITSFMGVPLRYRGTTTGLIGLASKESGYSLVDQQDIETLSVAFVEALNRKRAERLLKKLDRELEQRVTEVSAINKELKAFSYSVSHDLRAPLRVIDGFSRALLEDCYDRLDEEGKRFLSIIRSSTEKMGQLIDDLLVFLRVGNQEIGLSEINMEQLARAALDELIATASCRALHFNLKELLPAQGDQPMIRQVFINLLSNAIKFTRPKEMAMIEVGGWKEEKRNVYFVKDNGVGFEMAYVNKLFGVFQRLHSVEEFEGTGVGLAIVQHIIQRHGGQVWAEGKVGEGATFYFTLPSQEK